VQQTQQEINLLVSQKKNCAKLDQQKTEYERKLLSQSKNLAKDLKSKGLDEEMLKREFDNMWVQWVTTVSNDLPPTEPHKVVNETEAIIFESLIGCPVSSRLNCRAFKKLSHISNYSSYFTVKKNLIGYSKISNEDANQLAIALTRDLIEKVKGFVKEKELAKVDYNPNFIREIIREVEKSIKLCMSKEDRFVFNNYYKTDVCLMLCLNAAETFQSLHDAFQQANDPLTYIKGKKQSCFATFENFCKGVMSANNVADLIGSHLKEAIQQSVYFKANAEIANEIRTNIPSFKGNRSNLENHILKKLAADADLDLYNQYLKTPKSYFEDFIREKIVDYCWTGPDPKIIRVFKVCVEFFCKQVLEAIRQSTETVEETKGDVTLWLDEFCRELQDYLPLPRKNLDCLEDQEIKDIGLLNDSMETVVKQVSEDLQKEFCKETSKQSKFSSEDIQKKILNNLCGCWVQCPFCKAICTNTMTNHDGDHSVEFHRPQALVGGQWHKTDQFTTDICSSLVGSTCHLVLEEDKTIPYVEYRKYAPAADWSITPDTSFQPYWKWVICNFRFELEELYSLKFHLKGEIPEGWESITKAAAIESLKMGQ
jgi:hypothetical protein